MGRVNGIMGATYRVATTDTATGLAANILANASGSKCDGVTLVCETANVRIAINADPTEGATGLGLIMYPGDFIRLIGEADVAGMKYISATSGVAGVLQILPEY